MEKRRGNPLARCPWCDYHLDGYTPWAGTRGEQATPHEGDYSICLNCRRVLVFRADQTVRKCTDKEAKEFGRWFKEYKREMRRKWNKKRRKKMN